MTSYIAVHIKELVLTIAFISNIPLLLQIKYYLIFPQIKNIFSFTFI